MQTRPNILGAVAMRLLGVTEQRHGGVVHPLIGLAGELQPLLAVDAPLDRFAYVVDDNDAICRVMAPVPVPAGQA